MKKLIGLLAISGMVFLSCGPSAAEKAAEEQRIQDSIAQAQADSIAAAEAEAAATEAQRIQDSIAQAEAQALAAAEAEAAQKTSKPAVKKKAEPAPAPVEEKASKLKGVKKVS